MVRAILTGLAKQDHKNIINKNVLYCFEFGSPLKRKVCGIKSLNSTEKGFSASKGLSNMYYV